MPSWTTIVANAVLSGVAATAGLLAVGRFREPRRVVTGAAATIAAVAAWGAVVRAGGAAGLLDELPAAFFPASWFDLGAAVWVFAGVGLGLGLGVDRRSPANRVVTLALGCAVAAFGVSVYLS